VPLHFNWTLQHYSFGVVHILGVSFEVEIQSSNNMVHGFRRFASSYVTLLLFMKVYYLTLSNPFFLPTAYSPDLICFGRERGWLITCNYLTVLKEKNIKKQKEYNLRYLLAKVRTT
jgi:hypothetical protein